MKMRRINAARTFLCLLLFFIIYVTSGCGTIYKVAVDKRTIDTQLTDEQITMAIRQRFVNDKAIKLLNFSVYCYDGHVYLVGEYETRAERQHALTEAKSVQGVRDITTYLLPKRKVPKCGTFNNVKLAAYVKAKLIKDMNIRSTNIEVKAVQCNVVLLGIVGSSDQVQMAIAHARRVEGVRKVISYLKVGGAGH